VIYEKIYNTLAPLGYTIREQGTFKSGETLPESFITFLIVDSPNDTHYDNLPTSTTYRMQITLYSQKPSVIQSANTTIKGLMLPAGFVRASGRSLPFNQDTGHYAWTQDYKLFETEE
jgi:hypothetical protein